jgi:hypothetical protein
MKYLYDLVNKYQILGITILSTGIFFLILTGFGFVQTINHKTYMETACSKPGTSCPVADPWFLVPYGIPTLVLLILGSYFLALF